MAKVKPLRQNVLFRELTARDVALVAQVTQEIVVSGGSPLDLKGSGGLVIVVQGYLRARMPALGKQWDLEIGPQEFFGELSLLSGQSGRAQVVEISALEETKLLWLEATQFAHLVEREPAVGVRILQSIGCYLQSRIQAHLPVVNQMIQQDPISHRVIKRQGVAQA